MGMAEKVHHHHHHHHLNLLHSLSFHHRHHHDNNEDHQHEKKISEIPKGCVAVLVGQGEEEQQKIVVPVDYVNHPLFVELLKEAEEEYGFDQKGPITIPCQVEEFKSVQGLIAKDGPLLHHHNHHHHHHIWCFGA